LVTALSPSDEQDGPKLREGETFEHEFDGIPDGDVSEICEIRDDFHRHGFDLRWLHPRDDTWIMQWTPHSSDVTPVYGQVQDTGEVREHDMTALETARRAWAKFESMRGGG